MVRQLSLFTLLLFAGLCAVAQAKTSHAGWPDITGILKMHKNDESAQMLGTDRNDELLGGHGHDAIYGGAGHDVIWGDYKPAGNTTSQVDTLDGGPGDDFIYASHGRNAIDAGPGNDDIKAHFGRGVIDCGPGNDILYVSRRGRPGWSVRNCERISHRTLGS